MENIQAAGFQVPTPIQMQAIPVMLHVSFLLLHFICILLQGIWENLESGCSLALRHCVVSCTALEMDQLHQSSKPGHYNVCFGLVCGFVM